MNLFDLSSTNTNGETYALVSTGGWVGTLPDGYTKTVEGKKFTVHTYSSGGQVLIHKLPGGGGTVRIGDDGSINWYDDRGELHREDGPAMSWNGNAYWFRHGRAHREDGPAVTWADGSTEWYYNGERHREDGPAVTWASGAVEYWIHGKRVNKEDLP